MFTVGLPFFAPSP